VDLRVFTEPQQGARYDELLAVARVAEECGFAGFFRSDHYLWMGPERPGYVGSTDAWLTLAALARETSRIRLGTLLTAATFRLPGLLAVAVAQVDAMSAGRVELGLGAGWYEAEHLAYGIPFPPVRERFDRLEEQLRILTGLWATPPGARFSFEGHHYRLVDDPGLPRPVQQPHPPLIVGGKGASRTPMLAARFADEMNVAFSPMSVCAEQYRRTARACEQIGRDPSSLVRSAALVICCGQDERELERRAAAIGRELPELRANGLAGTPEEVLDRIDAYATTGAARLYLQFLDLSDLDHLRLVAEEVLAKLPSRQPGGPGPAV
jgi:F420-dependent oxidoreductase-like protein